MLACLRGADEGARTFGASLDACSVAASRTHDACVEACHGEDVYHGWTPEAEEGEAPAGPFDADAWQGGALSDTRPLGARRGRDARRGAAALGARRGIGS